MRHGRSLRCPRSSQGCYLFLRDLDLEEMLAEVDLMMKAWMPAIGSDLPDLSLL
jgi:hypothetical protein